MAALPYEVEHAPGGADADDVEDDGLQRQQQRAERAREQHERDQRDQRDHQREVAVDGADEVGVLRGEAAEAHVARLRAHGAAHAVERRGPRARRRVGGREGVDHGGSRPAPFGQRRRNRTADPAHLRERVRDGFGRGGAAHEHLVRHQRAGADAGTLDREQPLLGLALLGDVVDVREAELEVGRGEDERGEDERGAGDGDPAAANDEVRPARPRAARPVVVAHVRPVEPRADAREHDGQQGHRDDDADQRDQEAAVADGAQERQRQRDERQQADRDGRAAEHDRAPRGLHRAHDRGVALQSVRALFAPADDDEQRVVDRDAEADERDEELHDRRDFGDGRDAPDDEEAGEDRGDRHHDRHEREERAEHEGENQQRADTAEERLDEHAGPVATAALNGERVEAGDAHGRAGDGHAAEGFDRVFGGFGVVVEGLFGIERRVHDREGRAPVARDERAGVTRARVPRDARAGQCSAQPRFDAGELRSHGRRADGCAIGQRDDREQRRVVAAGAAELVRDLLVGDEAFATGDGELLFERF